MRVSKAEKQKTRDRILAAASQLFRERGLDQVGVAEVMQASGLTHGGFYRHFANRDDLAIAATTHAFDSFLATDEGEPVTARAFIDRYLQLGHVQNPGHGCPITAMGADFARADPALHDAFEANVRRVIDLLATALTGPPQDRTAAATSDLATMVGTVILARLLDDTAARRLIDDARSAHDLPAET